MKDVQIVRSLMKTWVRGAFRRFGFELRRLPPFEPYGWLKEWRIRTILDIGANVGQFASQIHRLIPDAMLYSFEPLEDCYDQLRERMRHVSVFRAYNLALGDKNGREWIYRNDFTPSSSILPMDEHLKRSFPFAARATPREICISRLDDLAEELVLTPPILIKIDVQGMEDKVILGGDRVFSRTSILIVETTFETLYRGQALFDRVYDLLRDRGFRFMGSEHSIRDPKSGRVLQCDAVFIRRTGDEAWARAARPEDCTAAVVEREIAHTSHSRRQTERDGAFHQY